jgi:hypothetical protein
MKRAMQWLLRRTAQIPIPAATPRAIHKPAPMDWRPLLAAEEAAWRHARREAEAGKRVLLATAVGGLSALSLVESMLAAALTLRRAKVEVLLCDHAVPACLRAELENIEPARLAAGRIAEGLCAGCEAMGEDLFNPFGLVLHRFSDFLNDHDRTFAREVAHNISFAEVPTYRLDGLSVGEHAYAGALRYFARGDIDKEEYGEAVARRYLEAGILSTRVAQRLIGERKYEVAVFNHGIYAPHGIFGEVCRAKGTRVVNWNVAYRKKSFIFSHGDTYHHTLVDEPTTEWEGIPWSPATEAAIDRYLASRWKGTSDWIWFHEHPEEEPEKITGEIGIDFSKPLVGMLTNVMWDAQLHYRANAFPNMLAWVKETIAYFASRPDLQLVIRIHPAEMRGTLPSRQPLEAEIRKIWPELPRNIFVIKPDSQVSTYAVLMRCDAALIYGTKMGVELTSVGVPVIVGGEAWIRNKGLTLDARSPEEYVAHLERLPFGKRLDADTTTKAKKYAYHFFFRRMIPVSFMEPAEGWPPYRVAASRLNDLCPGADLGLDVICEGILNQRSFVFPAESLTQESLL